MSMSAVGQFLSALGHFIGCIIVPILLLVSIGAYTTPWVRSYLSDKPKADAPPVIVAPASPRYFVQCWGGRNSVLEEYSDKVDFGAGVRWTSTEGKVHVAVGNCIITDLDPSRKEVTP